MKKALLIIIASLLVLVAGINVNAGTNTWDGVTTKEPDEQLVINGVLSYVIEKPEQLAYIAQNGGEWLTYNYVLTRDIVLNDVTLKTDEKGELCVDVTQINQWTAIGEFSGTFNGYGHKISGVYVKGQENTGFFSNVTGSVTNLILDNLYAEGTVNVGGVCGVGRNISNCSVYGTVKGSENVGGIAGYFYTGRISGCINCADVYSDANFAGGIAGRVDHTGIIEYCGNKGDIYGINYIGGVVGYTPDIILPEGTPDNMIFYHISVVNGCYNTGDITGVNYVGGVAGYTYDTNIARSYTVGEVAAENNAGLLVGCANQLAGPHRGSISGCYYRMYEGMTAFGNVSECDKSVAEGKECEFFPICVNPDTDPAYEYLGYAYIIDFVDRLYTNVLNRKGDMAGKINWAVTLKNGTNNGASLASVFVLGEEFKLRNVSDLSYVIVLYLTFLDRNPDNAGMANWLAFLEAGHTRESLLAQFVNSKEFSIVCERYGIDRGMMFEDGTVASVGVWQFVDRLYKLVLGREGDYEGYNNWVNAIASKSLSADLVAMQFFESQEYLIKEKDNIGYVNDLYQVFMNRNADEAGLNYWVSCMTEHNMSREWVAGEFAKSYEFYLIMKNYALTGE